jgi:hypothetical protein
VAAGKADPHAVCRDRGPATCGQNGLCDGSGACSLYEPTTVCLAGSCDASTLHLTRHCDGKGACLAAADVDCTPNWCNPATKACSSSH